MSALQEERAAAAALARELELQLTDREQEERDEPAGEWRPHIFGERNA